MKILPPAGDEFLGLFKRILCAAFVICLLSSNIFAQQRTIDSLQKILKYYHQEDTTTVKLISELANTYQFIDPDTMILLAQEGLGIAQKIGFKNGEADCIKQFGIAYYVKGEYEKALDYDERALKIYESLHYQKGIADVINNLANIYSNQSDHIKSLEYYMKSLKIREEIGDIKGVSASLNNIGNTYTMLGNYSEALSYHLRALNIREQLNDKRIIANSFGNIGNVYHSMGKYAEALKYYMKGLRLYQETGSKQGQGTILDNIGTAYYSLQDYPKALEYLNKSLIIDEQMGQKPEMFICISNIGEIYLKQHQYDKSWQFYQKGLKLARELGDKEGLASVLSGLGQVSFAQGKIRESIGSFQQAYSVALEVQAKLLIADILENLSKAYEAKIDYQNALKYHKLFNIYKDSLFNENTNKKTQQLQFDYELDKKQQAIELLEKDRSIEAAKTENQRIISLTLAVGVVLLCMVAFILYRSRQKEKFAKELILKQKEEMQSQAKTLEELNKLKDKIFSILSHDLRSPISSLHSLMYLVDEKIISANEFTQIKKGLNRQLSALSLLLDNLLNWSRNQMEGHSETKSESLKLNEMVQQNFNLFEDMALHKQIKLDNDINVDLKASGDRDQIDIVLRNLISNALKFTNENGKISISAEKEDNKIIVLIKDNGIGMDREKLEHVFSKHANFNSYGTGGEKGTGLGLLLCKEFIEKNGGTIYVSSKPDKGTTFYFTLPEFTG